MTRAPMASNARGGTGPFSPDFLAHTNNTPGIQFWVAQVLADRFGVTREEMDAFALESHRRAAENSENGFLAHETLPVPIRDADGNLTGDTLTTDEGIRRGGTMESLGALPPRGTRRTSPRPRSRRATRRR